MKGTLNKHEEGWLVRYGDMQFIPLHPDFIEMMDTCFTSKFKQVVEFEIVTEWENGEVGVNGLIYAKLIHHSVEPNEMIDHIGDANKMVEDDVWNVGLGDELNKLPYTKHLDDGQYNDGVLVGYELGATWGYNKAKETLYTKEQVQKMIDDALINYEIGWADRKKQFSLYEHKETITSADTPVSKTFLESIPKQETLYTEEQVRDIVLKFAEERTFLRKGIAILWIKNYFKSLKQPKQ